MLHPSNALLLALSGDPLFRLTVEKSFYTHQHQYSHPILFLKTNPLINMEKERDTEGEGEREKERGRERKYKRARREKSGNNECGN